MKKIKTDETMTAVDYKVLKLSSTSFNDNGKIPIRYSGYGQNVNPEINIQGIPEEAKSLAIIVDDPDAPGRTFCHWVIWNIPVTHHIKENESRGTTGMNDFSHHHYDGPCPPSGTHRYYFKIYALDCILNIPVSSDKLNLEQAMSDHVIGFGILTGYFRA